MKNFILEFKEEIRYTSAKSETIKEKLLQKNDYEFMREKNFSNFEDKREYEAFIMGLGKTDVLGQMSYCEQFSKRIEDKYLRELKKFHEMGKIYCVLGVCGGLSLSLIII